MLAACSFSPNVPNGHIICKTLKDCPSGYSCEQVTQTVAQPRVVSVCCKDKGCGANLPLDIVTKILSSDGGSDAPTTTDVARAGDGASDATGNSHSDAPSADGVSDVAQDRSPDAVYAADAAQDQNQSGTGGVVGAGGVTGTGGMASAGGTTGAGGATSTGGATGQGGATVSGGATAVGGTSAKGGATGAGGVVIAGGTTVAGGATSAGGAAITGGTTGTGGATTSGGIVGSGGATTMGGTTGTGGSASGGTTATGGTTSSGGVTSTGGATIVCPVDPTVISNFESTPGQADMNPQGSAARTGWWYVFYPGSPSAVLGGGTQSPAANNSGPIATAAAPDASTCNKYAIHSTGSVFGGTIYNYVGFGAGFSPKDQTEQIWNAYDASAYTGIKFRMKAGSGTQQAVYFEILTQETISSSQGGLLGAEGGADVPVGLHNNRGQMLNDPWTPGGITSTYQTFTVPFGTLVPRWVPAAGTATNACPTSGTPKCQAPAFNPAHVLGIQVSMYQDPGFPKPAGSTPGNYDLWIDDVAFTTDDSGLQTRTGFPLTAGVGVGSCLLPQGPGASAKYLVPAYNQWKATFVKGAKVVRPEFQNDTVSEGIAYGMLIAVNMNDQALFDSLYGTWKANAAVGTLMAWCLGGGGGGIGQACAASGGSATDADEDAAFALLMAGKAWGGTYNASALTMIGDIWIHDIDGGGTNLPKGGSNYGGPSGTVTNASYFAPAFYREFVAVDTGHNWGAVIAAVYNVINGTISGSNGLIPAWCSSSCTAAGNNGAATDGDYQYDSHRIPMRFGMDYCFNATAGAKTYTTKTTAFFANAAANGIGFVQDIYTPAGGPVNGTTTNSASILGTAAVGAMASGNQTFLNNAYQAVFDTITRGSLAPVDAAGKTPYSYFNATVGLLTALIMTGNFMH
jgi:endo-1,4-beta-D-glucanase Y